MLKASIIKLGDHMPEWMASGFRSDTALARAARPLLNRMVPEQETVVSIRSGAGKGLSLPVMPKSEKYYWTGTHEQHVQDAMVELLEPGMRFWDVGAHIGFFSIIAARLVGDTGAVMSFEPMPETRARLERSVQLNDFDNVSISEYAIGDTSETGTLHPPKLDDADAGGVEGRKMTLMWTLDAERGDGTGMSVDCRRLDDIADQADPPDLLKIDAEGVEIEALAGGIDLLKLRKTKVIVEMSDRETLERGRSLLPEHHFELIGANHWLLT